MEKFSGTIKNKLENYDVEESIGVIIEEFPYELQDRLWNEIQDMDDHTARDFLIAKLVERKQALIPEDLKTVPEFMEVVTENPEAVKESIELTNIEKSKYFLGKGQNGEVLASTRQEGVCYKTLFLERAKELGINITREALMQHKVHKVLQEFPAVAQVPEVYGFVKTDEVRAIKMERLTGCSVAEYLHNPQNYPLPEGFDADTFFKKLEDAVRILNRKGYFHRDLSGNAGNVFITSEGEPYLIDFGSAVKSIATESDGRVYRLTENGAYYHSNDLSGVAELKKRFVRQLSL